MADNQSETGSLGREGSNDEEEEGAIPKVITEEYFADLIQKTNTTIKNLQGEQQYNLAEEIQRIIGVSVIIQTALTEQQLANVEMQDEVENAVGKVAAAFQLSQTDQDTIVRLKDEIENAWKQTDAAQTRELSAQEQLYEMRDRLDKLQVEIKKSEKRNTGDELGMNLAKHKEGILRERDRLNAEVEELNKRLQIQRIYTDEIEQKRTDSEKKNKELYKLLDETSSEAYQKLRMVDQLKQDIVDLTASSATSANEIKHLKTQIETIQTAKNVVQTTLNAIHAKFDKTGHQLAVNTVKLTKTQADLEAMTLLRNKCSMELGQNVTQLKFKDTECTRLARDNVQLTKSREQLQKKLMAIESSKADVAQELLKLKNTILTFEKERDSNKKAFEKIKKFGDDMLRERDLVRKDLQRSTQIIGEQAEVIMMHEQHLKQLDLEIVQHLEAAKRQKSLLEKVKKERDKNAEEAQVMADKLEQCQDDLLSKINQITELKENITEIKAKLAQIQLLFETARSERNAFQRDLQATVEDRDDLRERFRIANGQIDQLKEDLAVKESELVRANKTIEKLEKDKIALKLEIQNTNIILQHTRTELKEKKLENDRLYKTLSDDELQLMKLRTNLDSTTNEKDLIGTQMIRRNDEIGLLNEKINIITMALDRGEAQYNKRLDDIRLLKIEIANLRSQRNLLTRGLANTADMRQEVLQLNRALTQERVRAKALEQEMMTPMNIHRWRKLSGKDPDKMELILKIQALQKRILKQTVVGVERENAMQETHELYDSLKQFMSKLPNHSVKEKLNSTQRALSSRTKKLKALTAEVKANQIDDKSAEMNQKKLFNEIQELRQSLLKQKKDNQQLKDCLRSYARDDSQSPLPAANGYKTVGSGFRMPNVTIT